MFAHHNCERFVLKQKFYIHTQTYMYGICAEISVCGVKPFGFSARSLLLCVQCPTLAKPLRILLFLLLLLSSGQLFHLKRRSQTCENPPKS